MSSLLKELPIKLADDEKPGGQGSNVTKLVILAAGVTGAAAALGFWWWWKKSHEYHLIGTVSKIFLYPIKSCRYISLEEAEVSKLGMKSGTIRDREFMIVKSNGQFVTARQEPSMILIASNIQGDELWLDAPNMQTLKLKKPSPPGKPMTVRIWGEPLTALDCGEEVEKWICDYLKKPDFKLVYFPDEDSPRKPGDVNKFDKLKETDNAIFADVAPFMLMSDSSVEELNTRLEKKVTMEQFRPSFAIQGCRPYVEEYVKIIKVGDIVFRNVKLCTRCVLCTIDPETGVMDRIEPLETLKKYKQLTNPIQRKLDGESPVLGSLLAADTFGKIKVGDEVLALL